MDVTFVSELQQRREQPLSLAVERGRGVPRGQPQGWGKQQQVICHAFWPFWVYLTTFWAFFSPILGKCGFLWKLSLMRFAKIGLELAKVEAKMAQGPRLAGPAARPGQGEATKATGETFLSIFGRILGCFTKYNSRKSSTVSILPIRN